MNLYIYSDESGVLDNKGKYFVYSGFIFIGDQQLQQALIMYGSIEKSVKKQLSIPKNQELKGISFNAQNKYRIIKILKRFKDFHKFSIYIEQDKIRKKEIFKNQKNRRRFLDYLYKFIIKSAILDLTQKTKLNLKEVQQIFINVDNQSIKTSGWYDLKSSIVKEFTKGMYNYEYDIQWDAIFPNLNPNNIHLQYCNSKHHLLIRLSDLLANSVNFSLKNNKNIFEILKENFIVVDYTKKYPK
ncbi:DUF3800 domain-containing protein [Mesomycoplasma lagogenitalium]|uniref:DUF3800 domain-containing protein n=1 Tax=Mesomycoplasma lagogenitalium TaxID=171286 RepID=A0ABY8LTS5_9BACT|nr:DUF3800 domain-containing protein [Mesomycoplasma lagogenitalium]WGI36637.1 DUF3800 domain-containing protein [Mesomycoplasma lagogenitalium]